MKLGTNEMNAHILDDKADIYFIHDPQPCALFLNDIDKHKHWVWRCHIDFSNPDLFTWYFLKQYVERYDASIFSAPSFARKLNIPQVLISPSIDPFSDKNKDLTQDTAEALWKSKPVIAGAVGGILLQISHKYSGLLTNTI
jgi:trehalose synthase